MTENLKQAPVIEPVTKIQAKDLGKPSASLKPVTEKQDEYELEITRDYYGNVDVTYLAKKDPDYAYRFLRDDFKAGGKNISIKTSNLLFQKGGWQVCPEKHLLEKLGFKPHELSPDKHLRRGDLVLAYMPKRLFLEKEAQKYKTANEPIEAVKRLVTEGDPKRGSGIHETMRGIQTKKQLRGNWK